MHATRFGFLQDHALRLGTGSDDAGTTTSTEETAGGFGCRGWPQREHRKGEVIFHAGDPATSLYLITEGRISLVTPTSNGHERILAILGPGDLIGEAVLADAESYQVDAVALSPARTVPLERERLHDCLQQMPELALALATTLTRRLIDAREQLSKSYDPVKIRLVKTLLEQAQRFGRPLRDGWLLLQTELSHDRLAALIGSTRVSVSQAISGLRREGLLEGTRGRYRLDAGGLMKLTEA